MKLTVKLDFGCGREMKVGTFSEIGRDTAFEFSGEFISSGLNPSPFRLPPSGGLKVYDRSGNMETFGLFDDSLPDGWGRRIVDRMFMKREGRLPTVTERLMCVGRSGKGALVARAVLRLHVCGRAQRMANAVCFRRRREPGC